MSIRNILVPVRGDGKGEQVLNAAVALAKKFDAHIDVVHARMASKDLLAYGATLAGVRDVVNEIAETHAAELLAALHSAQVEGFGFAEGFGAFMTVVLKKSGVEAGGMIVR
mgnify:CR=1 FL=1